MGSRYPEEENFSLYDPKQDWEGLRAGPPPRYRSTPLSPRGPISPRAPPPGMYPSEIYPPELDHDFYNRSGLPGSPRERPFGLYDLEQDLREIPRQGMDTPYRPSEAELGYYNSSPRSPKEFDSRSRGVGRGTTPPLYINPNFDHLSISQGAPPNGKYGLGAPLNDSYGRGIVPNDSYGRGAPPNDGYGRGALPNDSYGRGAPPNDGYGRGAPPNDGYGRGAPPNDGYGRGALLNDNYGRGTPPNDSYGRGALLNDNYAQRTPPNDSYGRGTPSNDSYARGAPPNDNYGRGGPRDGIHEQGVPPPRSYGRRGPQDGILEQGVPPPSNYGRGVPPDGIYEHETPSNRRHGHEASIYEQGTPSNDTYGQGSLESGYGGRGTSRRAPTGTIGNNYGAPTSGTKPPYAEESSGYTRGIGRGQGVAPLGDGRYEYGGLHPPERLDIAEDYNRGTSTPAPISSEYAHQVYASVFSDPVYGGARQLNSRAGYHEQPDSVQQAHHREDVLRHPDDF